MAAASLFTPGSNCWRVSPATRAAFIVDGEAYFRAFVEAVSQARHSILITGWDFHSRTRLLCSDPGQCELELGAFLNDLARQRRGLRIRILIWDYPMIMGLQREWSPGYGLGWRPHRRVQLRYDDTHPVGASHHQKLVVIDDVLAFNGGIDLTGQRWDTCAHAPEEEQRHIGGTAYPPFHDLMMAVEGPVARDLGELFRKRWQRATGEWMRPPRRHRMRLRQRRANLLSRWPASLQRWIDDVPVAVSRTEPPMDDNPGVYEIQQLYLDQVATAKRCLYIENQYFTADVVAAALAESLRREDGPEIIVVLRELSHGWLEDMTMQVLRNRVIEQLRAADVHGRFHVYFPHVEGLKAGTCIDVHSKLTIVDDEWARIGSANLANRSMGLDTECDLTVAAQGDAGVRQQITDLRNQLLGEHLGCAADEVAAVIQRNGSVNGAIQVLLGRARTLKPLEPVQVPAALVSVVSLVDPEKPVALADMGQWFSPGERGAPVAPAGRSVAAWPVVVSAVSTAVVGVGVWLLSGAGGAKAAAALAEGLNEWSGPGFMLAMVMAYIPASFLMLPLWLLTLFAALVGGPSVGLLCGVVGVMAAALANHAAALRFPLQSLQRLAALRMKAVFPQLRRRGWPVVAALRLVPLAPFAVVGAVAGALRMSWPGYLVGTLLGAVPGILVAVTGGTELRSWLQGGAFSWWLPLSMALLAAAMWLAYDWLLGLASRRYMARFMRNA